MTRSEILEAARKCVCGDREQDYGTPENSFSFIASLWTDYTGHKYTAKDVAMMMALLKVARIRNGDKADSFVDLAGYAACAGELATAEAENTVRKSGVHSVGCLKDSPECLCNRCSKDHTECCYTVQVAQDCPIRKCEYFEAEA